MAKDLKFLLFKRDLNFRGLKQDEKSYLYNKYNVMLKVPHAKYCKLLTNDNYSELYNNLESYCRKTKRKDRQLVFHGLLLEFSIKEYYMLCFLLIFGEIDEQDFNAIDFRPNRCSELHKKQNRNIEKSLADLKTSMRTKIQKICETQKTPFNMTMNNDFVPKFFNEAFSNFAYINNEGSLKTVKTKYKRAKMPEFLCPICKH